MNCFSSWRYYEVNVNISPMLGSWAYSNDFFLLLGQHASWATSHCCKYSYLQVCIFNWTLVCCFTLAFFSTFLKKYLFSSYSFGDWTLLLNKQLPKQVEMNETLLQSNRTWVNGTSTQININLWPFFPILWCSQTGYHPQEDLAKFGHRPNMKVELFKNLFIGSCWKSVVGNLEWKKPLVFGFLKKVQISPGRFHQWN
jgi:hypothetical protein